MECWAHRATEDSSGSTHTNPRRNSSSGGAFWPFSAARVRQQLPVLTLGSQTPWRKESQKKLRQTWNSRPSNASQGAMGKLSTSILLSLIVAAHSVLAAGVCMCEENRGHHVHDSEAGWDWTPQSSHPPNGPTAVLHTHSHSGEGECSHTALGAAVPVTVAKRGIRHGTTVSLPHWGAPTLWPVLQGCRASSIPSTTECAHHWLASLRSVVLLL